jgi:uncharacterized protein DUF2637
MNTTPAVGAEADTRSATRFFWEWLFVATSMSVAGNVMHAIMSAPRGTVALAAAAAVVPPAVLLGSTHSVALLIKTRRLGVTYWCALLMTVALAGCAFVLSFDALRDLAVSLGFHPSRAWLWPVAIDVSIAQSTLALLTLAPSWRAQGVQVLAAVPDVSSDNDGRSVDPAAVAHWKTTADQLVRDGVTSKDPDVVAAILAEHAAGTPPSTIGRRQNVHHTTVGRILNAVGALSL